MALLNGLLISEKLSGEIDDQGRFIANDERGYFAMVISGQQIEFLEVVEFRGPDVVRASHYHTSYTERLYVISGRLLLTAKAISTSEQVVIKLEAGTITTVSPGVAHVFRSLLPTLALSMGAGSNPFVDRHAYSSFDAIDYGLNR